MLQNYIRNCEDTYFVRENNYFRIYKYSFGAKILRDDCSLRFICKLLLLLLQSIILHKIINNNWYIGLVWNNLHSCKIGYNFSSIFVSTVEIQIVAVFYRNDKPRIIFNKEVIWIFAKGCSAAGTIFYQVAIFVGRKLLAISFVIRFEEELLHQFSFFSCIS